MYRITVTCKGLTQEEGQSAPAGIEEEFGFRTWHQNPKCRWNGQILYLTLENDYDSNGLAVMDEFSDAINACINISGEISVAIESVAEFVA
jgi:hypothetical protein